MVKSSAVLFWSLVSSSDAGRTGCNDWTCKGTAKGPILPLHHPLLAKNESAVAEQVHLIGGSPGKVAVVWAGPLIADPGSQGVEYCERDGDTCVEGTKKFTVGDGPWVYDSMDGIYHEDFFPGEFCPEYKDGLYCFYSSPPHYYASLEGLEARSYLYRIRGETAWRNFKAAPAIGQPMSFGIMADLGQYDDSVATMNGVDALYEEGLIDTMLFPGDLSYANNVGSRWDSYGRMQEPLFSKIITAYVGGNHEIEKGMENWIHFTNRYPSMHLKHDSGSPSDLFFSFNVGLAHVVMMCTYCPTEPGSAQYEWLVSDLAKVDKSRTPWLIGAWHSPWYTSCTKHTMEEMAEMRGYMEDMIHEAGFDIIFNGHNHAYERTLPVYKNETTPCGGTVYVTVGDAGGDDWDDKIQNDPYAAKNGFSKPWITPETPRPPMYDQPDWSALRAFEWGFARFQIHNATHAEYFWYNSYDNTHTVKDHAILVHADCGTALV